MPPRRHERLLRAVLALLVLTFAVLALSDVPHSTREGLLAALGAAAIAVVAELRKR